MYKAQVTEARRANQRLLEMQIKNTSHNKIQLLTDNLNKDSS